MKALVGLFLGLVAGCPGPMVEEDMGADQRGTLDFLLPDPRDLGTTEVPRVRGNLADLIDKEPTSLTTYQAPSQTEVDAFRAALALLLMGQGEQAQALLLPVGYTVTDFTDDVFDPVKPRRFYVLRERDATRRYRGMYILRRDAARAHVYLESPYAVDSFVSYLRAQAGRTLLSADVGGLLLNTADRCANAQTPSNCIKCAGSCLTCNGSSKSYFPVSDFGAAEGTLFQAAHEVLSAGVGTVFLSIHGHANTTAGYVISDGTKETASATAVVHKFRDAFTKFTGLTVKSCNNGGSTQLCGETLLQGRFTNGYMPLCSGTQPKGERRFVQIQQLVESRRFDAMTGPGEQTILARTIASVWP